jgi:hypothetical protein
VGSITAIRLRHPEPDGCGTIALMVSRGFEYELNGIVLIRDTGLVQMRPQVDRTIQTGERDGTRSESAYGAM